MKKFKGLAFAFWLGLAGLTVGAVAVQAVVSTTTPRNDYVGNGSTATYSYTFRIFDATDLRVTRRDNVTNVETALSYPGDYSVTGVNKAAGGTITLVGGNLTSGHILTIRFDRTPRQSTDLRNQGSFFPETHEAKFDELTKYAQQNKDVLDRALKLPETEAGTPAYTTLPVASARANKFMAWDGSGNPMAAAGTSANLTPVSSFINGILDDTTGNQVFTALGAATSDPRLILNTTAAGNRRGLIDFQQSGTSKFLITLDQANLNTQVLNFYDSQNNRTPLSLDASGNAVFYGQLDLSQSAGASAGQIKFPATQVASANANTLDDYEEGTWIPSLGGNTTYSAQVGRYNKIGRQVHVDFSINVTTLGTGSTTTVTGLPFTSGATYISVGACSFNSLASSLVFLTAQINASSSSVIFPALTGAATGTSTPAIFGNSAQVSCSVTYSV